MTTKALVLSTLGASVGLTSVEFTGECRHATELACATTTEADTMAAWENHRIAVREVPLEDGLPRLSKEARVAGAGNWGFSFEDFWPAGTEIISGIGGTTHKRIVRQRPEVMAAQPVVDQAFSRHRAEISAKDGEITLTPEAMEMLDRYFEAHPSEFGRELLSAVRSKSLPGVASVLKRHGLYLFGENRGTILFIPHGVGRVESVYRLDEGGMERLHHGWLATMPAERTALTFSGIKGTHPFLGHATFDLATGRPIAVVDTDAVRRFASESGFAVERVMAAIIANESMHLEQYNRWGRDAVAKYGAAMELISDARMLELDPEVAMTFMVTALWENKLFPDPFRRAQYGESAKLLADQYNRVSGKDLVEEMDAAIKAARGGDEDAVQRTIDGQGRWLRDPAFWEGATQAFLARASEWTTRFDRKLLPAYKH